MSPRSLAWLGAVTVIACALAVVSSLSWNRGDAVSERGKVFAPAVVKQAQEIGAISVADAAGEISIVRDGTVFRDASGYPVKLDVVRDLIRSVSTLKIEERKTDDPSRHGELDLAEPGAPSGVGRIVKLAAGDGKEIESIVVGKADYTVGGGAGGHHVRRAGDDQAFLVRGSVKLPFGRSGWFETAIFDIGEGTIVRAVLSDGNGTEIVFDRRGDVLTISELPAGRALIEAKAGRVGRSFGPLRFEDVRAATQGDPSDMPALSVETDTGLALEIRTVEEPEGNARWVRISAIARKTDADGQAKLLSQRLDGFEFQLETRTGEILGWTLDDLTEQGGS